MNSGMLVCVLITALILAFAPSALAVIDNADSLYVGPGESYTLGGVHEYNVLVRIEPTANLYVADYGGFADEGYLELRAPTILVDGTIDGNGAGYRGAVSAHTYGEGPGGGTLDGAGGGYGGPGGASGWGNPGGPAYGTADGSDIQMGSGGGKGNTFAGNGGDGGGMVSLIAETMFIHGYIVVNGNNGGNSDMDGGGAGSGGGIYLRASEIMLTGTLTANGGNGGGSGGTRKGGGGGGGGRIKIFYCYLDDSGLTSVMGGAGGVAGTNGQPGSAGTTHLEMVPAPIITSVEDVENDQGRQVRITWLRACLDDPEAPDPVTRYTIWRRIDELRAEGDPDSHDRLTYPPGDWDFVAEVPARGEGTYNTIVPTLADSNATGMHWSVFFVSGVTDDPFVYYDSGPDSGYSVDNLSPAPPAGLLLTRVEDTNHIEWEESPEEDFDYYSLHRGESDDFVPDEANLVATLIETSYDDVAPILSYYKLAAVDFNGNISPYSLAPPDVTDIPDETSDLALSLQAVSPVSDQITVRLALPTDAPARVCLYDVAGRLVLRRDVSMGPGEHSVVLADRSELASGVYFAHLTQGGESRTERIVFVK